MKGMPKFEAILEINLNILIEEIEN